jgi:hypothetical protein
MNKKYFEKTIENTDLLLVFTSLTDEEIRDLHRFVRSPYFNQREDVILLFDYLRENTPKKNQQKYLSKTTTFEALYGNVDFDEKKLHYVLSFLLKIIYNYFSIHKLEQNQPEKQELLCKTLRQKHLENLFHKELRKAHDALEKQPLRNAKYHEKKANLYYEFYENESYQRREKDVQLQEYSNEITYSSIINILRQAWLMLSHKKIVKREYDFLLLEQVVTYVENNNFEHFPEIKVYYYLYKMLNKNSKHSDYRQAHAILVHNWQLFLPSELRNITLSIINYCSQAMRNDISFRHEGLNIYKFALSRGVLLENNILPAYTYRNIVTLAVGMKDFKWVFDFIHNFKSKLAAEKQETFFTYCLSNYYFRTHDYKKAQQLLSQVDLKDTLLNFDSKRILLMIYYENQEFDALDALLTSFKALVQLHKELSDLHKELNINMINMMKKMLNQNLTDKKIRQNLIEEVENTAIIAEQEWFFQQLKK